VIRSLRRNGPFWPQWYNLNNFGRGPLDDVIDQIWQGLVFLEKKIYVKIYCEISWILLFDNNGQRWTCSWTHEPVDFFYSYLFFWQMECPGLKKDRRGVSQTTKIYDPHKSRFRSISRLHDLLKSTRAIWTTLEEDHLMIIPVMFSQNPMTSFREDHHTVTLHKTPN